MNEEKKEETKVEIEGQELADDGNQPGIEVDLTKPEDKKAEEARKPDPYEELRKSQARIEYLNRQQEKRLRDIEEIAKRYQSPREPVFGRTDDRRNQYDEIARGDWQQAVKLLGKEAAIEAYQELVQNFEVQQKQQAGVNAVEESRRYVLENYPELANDNSVESKLYMEIVNEDPSILSYPQGYQLAMHKMEDRLETMGKTVKRKQSTIDREVERRLRTQGGSLPSGRNLGSSRKIVLTKDQERIAREAGIPLERYAQTLQSLEESGQVEA